MTDLFSGFCAPNWSALSKAPEALKERLRRVAERGDPYFILTGSDPLDEHGCCPSEGVGAANRLVESGVLSCYRQPAPPGSCPTAIYAFAGEISMAGRRPVFTRDEAFRGRAVARLTSAPLPFPMRVVKWILLAMVFATLVVALRAGSGPEGDGGAGSGKTLCEALGLPGEGVAVVVLSGREKCAFCENIKTYSKKTVEDDFGAERARGRLGYGQIDYDEPGMRHFKKRFGLFTASLLLAKVEGGKVRKWKVLDEAWRLFDDEPAFRAMLRDEITSFQKGGE